MTGIVQEHSDLVALNLWVNISCPDFYYKLGNHSAQNYTRRRSKTQQLPGAPMTFPCISPQTLFVRATCPMSYNIRNWLKLGRRLLSTQPPGLGDRNVMSPIIDLVAASRIALEVLTPESTWHAQTSQTGDGLRVLE